MIIGIGHDLTDFARIEKLIGAHEERFTSKHFTKAEKDRAEKFRDAGNYIAVLSKRFAAKEAAAKALGTGIAEGVYLKDIHVENDDKGRPFLKLENGALERLKSITPDNHKTILHLSLTDEPPLASAYVVIEACPNDVSDLGSKNIELKG